MKNNPFCSVVMSVYNGEEFLADAIDSIIQQTYNDFEFIIINDASTDNTLKIIQSYDDSRIIIINNDKNIFLPASLNKGIQIAKGKYIIRMDADDISHSDRIKQQIEFMENNPEVGILGSQVQIIGFNAGNKFKYELIDNNIKIKLLNESQFVHPSIIIRKSLLIDNNLLYDTNLRKNQDYDLFVRASKYTQYANLKATLLKYRQTENNVKRVDFNQKENIRKIQKKMFSNLGISISEKKLDLYLSIILQNYKHNKLFIDNSLNLFNEMLRANKQSLFYDQNKLIKHISLLWENICRNTSINGSYSIINYRNSKFEKNIIKKIYMIIILLSKNLFYLKNK